MQVTHVAQVDGVFSPSLLLLNCTFCIATMQSRSLPGCRGENPISQTDTTIWFGWERQEEFSQSVQALQNRAPSSHLTNRLIGELVVWVGVRAACDTREKISLLDRVEFFSKEVRCDHSSGAVWESRWTSWTVRPNEPSGFRGRKAILNHASALVSACP